MKAVGMLLVVLGTTGMGYDRLRRLKERIRCIGQAIWLFRFLESEIGYQKSTLSAAFERAADRMEGSFSEILGHVAERMKARGGEHFKNIWKEEWMRAGGQNGLCGEELSVIGEFATQGYQDVHMQLVQIQMIRERLVQIKKRLEAELQQKGRVYLCVGMLSGAVVSIILI